MSQGQRRLAAIMFTDMVGYTALGQRNESLSLAIVEEQRKVVRTCLAKHNGREVKTIGDAFLVEFLNAVDAVRCAYDIQRAIREVNLSLASDKRIHLRVGVHVGEVVESGGDISGDAVNVASRIEPLAENGGVCISRQVYDHVNNKVDLTLTSLGSKSLKNVIEPVEIFRVVMPWEGNAGGSLILDPKRIAVLPFSNMSSDPENEYFADGLTEELISALSRVNGLGVIARTSVMGYKGEQKKKINEIAKELEVGSILEGSVRKSGNNLRITAQLIDCRKGDHLWSESYNKQLTDVFEVQCDIAQTVADSLKGRLLSGDKERLLRGPTSDLEAYSLFMKGKVLNSQAHGKGDLYNVISYYERAIERDPRFGRAYAEMAMAYCSGFIDGYMGQEEAFPKLKSFAEKALQIDETDPDSHLAMALVLDFVDWNFNAAEAECRKAIEFNPSLARAHWYLGWILLFQKVETEEALKEARIALGLDPLSTEVLDSAGTLFLYAGRYDDAIDVLSKSHDIGNLGLAYVKKGDFDKGIPLVQEAVRQKRGEDPGNKLDLAYSYILMGKSEKAEEVLSELLLMEEQNHMSAGYIAGVYSALGQNDKAFEWLEKAVGEHHPFLHNIRVDFYFDNIRSDPRYPLFLKRLGLGSDK